MKEKRKKSMHRTYFFLCIIIICIISLSFTIQFLAMRRILFQNTGKLLQAAHRQSYENISRYLNNMESVAYSLGYNASVQKYLKEADPARRLMLFADVQTVFSSVSMMQNDVYGFAIYDRNGDFLAANGSNYQAIILDDKIKHTSKIIYSSIYPPNRYIGITVPYYIMTVPILDSDSLIISGNEIGTVVFTMNQSYIKAQVDTGNVFKGCNMMLVDEEGRRIAGFTEDALSNGKFTDKGAYIVLENAFPNNGWQLVTYLEKGIIADDMQPLWTMAIMIGLTITVLVVTFIVLLTRYILSPIESISHFMRGVSQNGTEDGREGVKQYDLPAKWNYDELASMVKAMNRMLDSLNKKTNQLLDKEKQYYEAVLAGNRMEVLAYRNQINPHFLYNTFECIKGIALSHNAPEIVELSQSLSQMFRYAVKGGNFVTVKEELSHMREYALIIRYRFMGRIGIDVEAEDGALSCNIPRLILQPIVENAVFHGLEKQIVPGKIQVRVFTEGDFLHMRVVDNGLGIDEETLRQTITSIRNPSPDSGIGLSNIAHRLSLFYGQNSEIKISSVQEEGTTVEVVLPKVWEVSEDVPGNYS